MTRLQIFKDTLNQCRAALQSDPNLIQFNWIIEQLEYLIDVEEGTEKDFSHLATIKIGWIAVRELDGYEDKDLITRLTNISICAKEMMNEKRYVK